MHLAQHLFDDIVAKGVTRNYSTKIFEKMHGPLKESYTRQTNFKNVGGQVINQSLIYLWSWLISYYKILKAKHCALISAFIRSHINQLDAYQNIPKNDSSGSTRGVADVTLRVAPPTSIFRSGDHFVLGSYKGKITIEKLLEREHWGKRVN